MNKFVIFSCINLGEEESSNYEGTVVALANVMDSSFMLFFPINETNAAIINFIMEGNEDYKGDEEDLRILEIYKTMMDSWKAGGRFLSGILMDTIFSEEVGNDVPLIRLVLSDEEGVVDSLVPVTFIHAVFLSALDRVAVIVSDRMLDKMLPDDDPQNDKEDKPEEHPFPEDKNIVDIARQIMSGRIRDN